MATWSIAIIQQKGDPFPWKAAVVAKNGKRQEVGEFLKEKEARSYAQMELSGLLAGEKTAPAEPISAPRPLQAA